MLQKIPKISIFDEKMTVVKLKMTQNDPKMAKMDRLVAQNRSQKL